jgi:DNA-binding transcriptional ArsR family regulator
MTENAGPPPAPTGPWTSAQQVTDVASLRALAHPLRAALLASLRMHGPATASELGRRHSETSGATSYHLRQLARFGFVEEDPEQPSRRERRWRATHPATVWDTTDFLDDPAGREAADWIARRMINVHARAAERWISERPHAPRPWVEASTSNDYLLQLTPVALARLTAGISELMRQAEAESAGAGDAGRVAAFIDMFPASDVDFS